MTRWWVRTLACGVAIAAVIPAASVRGGADQPARIGVLVLAHGGSERWNQQVRDLVEQADLSAPAEVAFGMGMHEAEVQAVQQAIDALERQGVTRIVAVPLLISSHSEVMRQYEYLLGMRAHGPWEGQTRPVSMRVPVTVAGALNDDAAVAKVLIERAKGLSQAPARETVILVAHGPTSEEDNAAWLKAMARLAAQIRAAGGFRAVVPVTMRDDAPMPIRAEATSAMRHVVAEYGRLGRVLVVPLLVASGGVEQKIPQRLRGLSYAYGSGTLLPHPELARWLRRQVDVASRPTSDGR